MLAAGTPVTVHIMGTRSFPGRLKFISDGRISVETECGAIVQMHFDCGLNTWRVGSLAASVEPTEPDEHDIAVRLRRLVRQMRKAQGCCEECGASMPACDCPRDLP